MAHRLDALSLDDTICVGDLPGEIIGERGRRVNLAKAPPASIARDVDELRRRREASRRAFADQERFLIEQAIRDADGNVTEAAARLGLHRVTVHKILRRSEE